MVEAGLVSLLVEYWHMAIVAALLVMISIGLVDPNCHAFIQTSHSGWFIFPAFTIRYAPNTFFLYWETASNTSEKGKYESIVRQISKGIAIFGVMVLCVDRLLRSISCRDWGAMATASGYSGCKNFQ